MKISNSNWILSSALGLALSAQTPLFAEPLIEAGRKISQAQCARCHVIGDFNPNGGISSTPSFQMMVNALPDWEERFSTFYAHRPHPAAVEIRDAPPLTQSMATMVRVVIDIEDVKAITAFAATLKEK